MDKNNFIRFIKKFLPDSFDIEIKKKKNNLIIIQKYYFKHKVIIHPVFLKADQNLIYDIILFIKNEYVKNKEDSDLINIKKRITHFYQNNYIKKSVKLKTDYHYKNITGFFSSIVNKTKIFFPDLDYNNLRISWSKNNTQRKSSIRFGSYYRDHKLIKLHPALDQEYIPDYFINSVIYHELAHFIRFEINKNEKPHSKKFHDTLLMLDSDYHRSKQWEKENRQIFFINH